MLNRAIRIVATCASSLFVADPPAAPAYPLSQYGDYRINPEDPPLWQWWIALALNRHDLKADLGLPRFEAVLGHQESRFYWAIDTLYHTPGNDADAFLMKARMMLIF